MCFLVPEKPGDTAEERAAALLAKNHLKPFIDNALDFLA